jgi:hypothetical protein
LPFQNGLWQKLAKIANVRFVGFCVFGGKIAIYNLSDNNKKVTLFIFTASYLDSWNIPPGGMGASS